MKVKQKLGAIAVITMMMGSNLLGVANTAIAAAPIAPKAQIVAEQEKEGRAQIKLNGEITKYLPYQIGEEFGIFVQAKVNSGLQESALPIKSTNLEIEVPTINETTPKKVSVVANSTKATNGIADGSKFTTDNYEYDEENQKIIIQTNNTGENQEKVSEELAMDEYLITFTYEGKEIYEEVSKQLELAAKTKKEQEEQENQENKNAIKGQINVKATIQMSNEETLEKQENIAYTIEEAKGQLTDFAVEVTNSISKGYLYANYTKQEMQKAEEEKKETIYDLIYGAQIYNPELTKELEFKIGSEKLQTNQKETIEAENNIITKQIKIAENSFQKILGTEGKIEVYDQKENLLGTIDSNTNKDENGNYSLDLSDKKVNEIALKTTAPITEGAIIIQMQKAFTTNQTLTKEEMQNITKVLTTLEAKTQTETQKFTKEMAMQEPVSKAEITLKEEEKLSTVIENKDVEIKVVLDTSNIQNALYKNPSIEIQMPKQVKKVELTHINLLLEEELKMKQAKVITKNERQVIQILLEGTQTNYYSQQTQNSNNTIAKGANIILKANITVDQLVASSTENIQMYYTNENTNLYEQSVEKEKTNNQQKAKAVALSAEDEKIGIATTAIEIVAPTGVATATIMDGYGEENESLTNSSTERKEAQIAIYDAKKTITVQGIVSNNYENAIENVFILGRLPFTGNKVIDTQESLGSNFDMPLTTPITMQGIDNSKIRIYYSTNGEATKDLMNSSNSWTESPSDLSSIKSYLIVITGEIEARTQLTFDYEISLPENLPYNKSSYQTYQVYYDNKSQVATIGETKVAGTVGVTTGEGPEVKMTLSSNMPADSTSEEIKILPNKNVAKFEVEVENTGKIEAKNAELVIAPSQYFDVVYLKTSTATYEKTSNNIGIGTLKPGEKKQISYYLQGNGSSNTAANIQAIKTQAELRADNIKGTIKSNEITFKVMPAHFCLINKTNTREDNLYSSTDIITYEIKLAQNTAKSDVTVTVPLPQNAEILEAYWNEGERDAGIEKKTGEVIAKAEFLGNEKNLIVKFKVKDNTKQTFSTKVFAQSVSKHDGTIIDYYYSNEQFVYIDTPEMTGSQKAPDKNYVKEEEEFTYQFTLQTSSKGNHTNVVLEDILPEEVRVISTNVELKNAEGIYSETKKVKQEGNKLTITIPRVTYGSIINITIKVKGSLTSKPKDAKEIVNKASISSDQVAKKELNSVKQYLEYNEAAHKSPITGENYSGGNTVNPTSRYKITGTVWVDANKNGEKEEQEALVPDVKVMLIYKSNSNIVKDVDTGLDKVTTTNKNGAYEFSNLENGEYLVIFLYDASKYDVTTYQAEGVGQSYNSDAVNMKITLDGTSTYAGVTNTIKLQDANSRDIDLGVYVAEKFDLKLDKYISKITLTTPTIGTRVNSYNDSKIQKVEILGRNVGKSNIIVEYKLRVTNEGQIPGYARKLIDYLPENAKFNTEINQQWYLSDDKQNVYNSSLANQIINPGESKEVTLVLSFAINDKNIGTTIKNEAEIYESYNEQGTSDFDSNVANKLEAEDDMSTAEIVLGIVTGKIVLYSTLTVVVIIMLGFGIYEIRKRVLKK